MRNRREFIKGVAGGVAGTLVGGGAFLNAARQAPQAGGPVPKRDVRVGGKKVKVVDIHAHANVAGIGDIVKGTPMEKFGRGGGREVGGERIDELNKRGIDLQVVHINMFWWYQAEDRDLAAHIVQTQDEGLSKLCAAYPDRLAAFTSPSLQFPDLAAQQLEHAVKNLKLRGAAVGGHVNGEPLSMPKYDPFWAKAQELGVMVFMHPNGATNVAKPGAWDGPGDLGNILGNPLETILFLSHMIYDGAFDRFPRLKVCGAHGGGYLPSYLGRSEAACHVRNNAMCVNKREVHEYLHDQILADSMVFSPEAVRHMVAEMGPSQIMYGTDIPLVWPDTVDSILQADIPDSAKEALLGGNAAKLLKL